MKKMVNRETILIVFASKCSRTFIVAFNAHFHGKNLMPQNCIYR